MKFWAEDDRPREKLRLKGRHSLSNAEILAILIGSGTRKASALDIAREILQSNEGSLDKLGHLDLKDFMQFNGIGEAKAITLISALELGRRRKLEPAKKLAQIKSSHDAYLQLNP
ncbi:MAG: UPF0758 domain-containing protein, partial [Luteibaculum sp.]